jgi:hypothetical protein
MGVQTLNGEWQVDAGCVILPVPVPGCVEAHRVSKRSAAPTTWRRTFTAPSVPSGRRLLLRFDAVSYHATVHVNGREIGTHEGMWDSFWFDITGSVVTGAANEIRVVIEKPGYNASDRFPLRDVLSGFIPDVACTFGGIWGDVDLVDAPGLFPEHAAVAADCAAGTAAVTISVAGVPGTGASGTSGASGAPRAAAAELSLRLSRNGREVFSARRVLGAGDAAQDVEFTVPLSGFALWSPEDPALYDLEAVVHTACGDAALRRRVGFREIRAAGPRLLLNNEPIYLRGALHWGHYPDRIVPRPTPEEIRSELAELKARGFNAVKHCLWVPRGDYYDACDAMGILSWLELPLWLPRFTPELDARMRREYPRIVASLVSHPSIVAWSLGCELGENVGSGVLDVLARDVRHRTRGALVCDNSGSGECYGGLAEDFSDFSDYHFYADDQNLEPLMDVFTPGWKPSRPWLFGEYADADTWRVVPPGAAAPWWAPSDPESNPISELKPDFRLHLQHERLAGPGMAGRPDPADPRGPVAAAAHDHALLHRKLTMESTRAFPEISGYNVTAIRDVPIATSGLFDDSMRSKFSPAELLPFNDDLVLVPRWDLARAWINGDRIREPDRYNQQECTAFSLRVVASNYRPSITEGRWSWTIEDETGAVLFRGAGVLERPLARGETRQVARIAALLPAADRRGRRLEVTAELVHSGGTVGNSWPLFVWPASPTASLRGRVSIVDPRGILAPLRERYGADAAQPRAGALVAATTFDDTLAGYVKEGGRALLVQRGEGAFAQAPVAFWREGFAIFEDHPVATAIPSGPFRELAFHGMATDTALTWIEPGGPVSAVRPIFSRIDAREFTARHYAVELAYGKGRLVVTTLRVEGGMGRQPGGLAGNSAALYVIDRILSHLQE